MSNHTEQDSAAPQLGVWDGVSIIIGIVVGVGIFKTPAMVFSNVSSPAMGMLAWALGGVLALIGALCYAELATMYPRSGGDYVYLTRAYGPWVGFLFGWAQLAVILTGSIGTMAYAFADYAAALLAAPNGMTTAEVAQDWGVWLAVGSVVVLTLVNVFGMVWGKYTQNILTVTKVVGLSALVIAGVGWGGTPSWEPRDVQGPGFGLAMVFVLYTYGGWNDAAFVAAEVRDRRRNIRRVLLFGTAAVMLVYLLINAAYLWGLGFEGVRSSSAPAADVLQLVAGDGAAKVISVLVMISALGAVNGLILTGSRIYSTVGADHSVFALLGRWHPTLRAPVWSLLAQAAFSLLLMLAVGTSFGREQFDLMLSRFGLAPLPWSDFGGGFDTLLAGTAPVFWLFFLLTGLSLFSLREKDRHRERPFSVPWYPFTPFIFCLMCTYMLYSSISYAGALSLLGMVPLCVGLPLYWMSASTAEDGRTEPL